jgi:anti-sigma factor RsiW
MTCEQFVARIRARLDGELPARTQAQFARHAAGCERCATYLAAYERTIAAARASADQNHDAEPPEDLVQSIMEEIRKAKNAN